eukprot:CAMPEP_0202738424 /NCGR_PEP_ID=MMETSP1388-20130828/2151_1 /ASSEMBLY_ACC=CAM_ASM_000864 /TAXON_ID=37098 /ORGANISM="Isochrysis sp, Strain CCMP1244" /LENGTH=137 /DNA_ID=CAMNT_0049405015 /DNA_START=72 /DNA_END=485 /DNA_ORIENTATION=-
MLGRAVSLGVPLPNLAQIRHWPEELAVSQRLLGSAVAQQGGPLVTKGDTRAPPGAGGLEPAPNRVNLRRRAAAPHGLSQRIVRRESGKVVAQAGARAGAPVPAGEREAHLFRAAVGRRARCMPARVHAAPAPPGQGG